MIQSSGKTAWESMKCFKKKYKEKITCFKGFL